MRTRLLLSAALPAVLTASGAWAVDISDDRTTPVSTATANGGAPDDVTITSDGSITLENAGPAVTVNSDNSVTNIGGIAIEDVDNAVGIRIEGGNSGTVTNAGPLTITESYTREDDDGDGDFDGPRAVGTGRVGILVEGPSEFDGDILSTGSGTIGIEGNDSAAIRVADGAGVTGDIRTRGAIAVSGSNSVGVDIQGPVGGRVETGSAVTIGGENASAVVIAAAVDGYQNNANITASGFTSTQISNYADPDDVPEGFLPPQLDDDDLLNGGPAIAIGADVREGFYNSGPAGAPGEDDDSDGNDDVKDIRGDFAENRPSATINVYGSSPAVLISPDVDPDGTGDIRIGRAVEVIRDTTDDDGDGDTQEVLATFQEDYGVVNRGQINAFGLNTGFDSQAIVITGSEDGTRGVVVDGGILNTNVIASNAREANTTGIRIGGGADAGRLHNTGTVRAEVLTETDHVSRAVLIENGAVLTELINTGQITVSVRGDQGGAIAIEDRSGTLLTITNTGVIQAQYIPDGDDDDGDGDATDTDERTGSTVALDLSSATGDIALTQSDDGGTPSTIVGDVLLGAGDDRFEVTGGSVTAGVLAFGNGSDLLLVSGENVSVSGAITDTDGDLTLLIEQGSLSIANDTPVQIASAEIGADGTLGFALSGDSASDGRISASGTVRFEDGAVVQPTLRTLLVDQRDFVLVGATDLDIEGDIGELVDIETAFIYNRSLETRTADGQEQLVLTLQRKSAQELGMDANQTSLYEPALEALAAQTDINQAFAGLDTQAEFFNAFNQLLPDFSGAPLYLITSTVDGATGAVGNRMDAARLGHGESAGLWAQEFLYYVRRDASLPTGAYDGRGFGFAAGADVPAGPFDAVGLNIALSTNEMVEIGGFDRPMQAASAGVGAYAGGGAGGVYYDLSGGFGYDWFESERRIIIGALDRRATSEWSGYHIYGSARLGYEFDLGFAQLRPVLIFDYLNLSEESRSETGGGGGFNLSIEDRQSDMMAGSAMLYLTRRFDRATSWFAPGLTLGVRTEEGSVGATRGTFAGFASPFALNPEGLPSTAAIVGFSVMGGTGFSIFGFNYDADIRDGFQRHTARVVVRLIF